MYMLCTCSIVQHYIGTCSGFNTTLKSMETLMKCVSFWGAPILPHVHTKKKLCQVLFGLPSLLASFIMTAPILSLLVTRSVLWTPMVGTLMGKSQSNSFLSESSAILESSFPFLDSAWRWSNYYPEALLAISRALALSWSTQLLLCTRLEHTDSSYSAGSTTLLKYAMRE